MKDKALRIPRDRVRAGIARCLSKAEVLLEDAKVLLGSSE